LQLCYNSIESRSIYNMVLQNFTKIMLNFYDYLPPQCPPADAFIPNNEEFFRVVSQPISTTDFIPTWLNKQFPDEIMCQSRWLSLFMNKSEAKNILYLPSHRGQTIACGNLSSDHWVIKQTWGRYISHHTWRPYTNIDPTDIFHI